jgi:hypothetical protein
MPNGKSQLKLERAPQGPKGAKEGVFNPPKLNYEDHNTDPIFGAGRLDGKNAG